MEEIYNSIIKIIIEFGLKDGLFISFFFLSHFWIYRLYQSRLRDRQKEIDRIAKDNREYRDKFMELINKSIQ